MLSHGTGSITHTCCSSMVREAGGSRSWIQLLGSLSLRRSSDWKLSSLAFPKCNRDWMNCVRYWVRTPFWRQQNVVKRNERQTARVTAHTHTARQTAASLPTRSWLVSALRLQLNLIHYCVSLGSHHLLFRNSLHIYSWHHTGYESRGISFSAHISLYYLKYFKNAILLSFFPCGDFISNILVVLSFSENNLHLSCLLS